jgi:hypothetical protein
MARPVIAALGEQQKLIEHVSKTAQHESAQNRQAFEALRHVATQQQRTIEQLSRGLQAIARAAGIERHVVTAMLQRTADAQNPAQPVPSPPSEPSPHGTVETKTPEAFADVMAPGLVPGSTNDVGADAASTVYTPGEDIDGPALKNLIDVTRPVDGTQNPRPLSETRTETEIRAGNPMNPQVAFPLGGEFQNAQRLSSKEDSGRTMAAFRLAKLRVAAATEDGSDIEIATRIERDASLSLDAINREIDTLGRVAKAASRKPPRNLVPRAANGVGRTVPSLQSTASQHTSAVDSEVADADLFD